MAIVSSEAFLVTSIPRPVFRIYSPSVYYNFPWCTPTDKQRAAIEDAAQKNDRAVAQAYGLENIWEDESKITAEMLKMYNQHSQGE